MKKITLFKPLAFLATCLFIVTFGYGQSEIIISQYIETSSGTTPKGIEIFNVSGTDITFSVANNLQISQGTNGGVCNNIVGINITSGTLLANEVWVIGTTDLTTFTNTNGLNLSGTTDFNFSFNGNDALQLYLGAVLQDEFGTCGNDPGGSWSGSGIETRNNNLQILDGLCDGDINGWTDPSERFTQIANGLTMTGFGNSPLACASCSGLTTTWNGSTWNNGAPDITTPAIINGSYNTSTANITACSLTVNNSTLIVNDNTYIEIENHITVNGGSIDVQPYGAIVQNNDSGFVTNNGSMSVDKETAPMDAWYEYTYWSSPVSGETISGAITDSHPERRFIFNSQNFLDATAENNNNNGTAPGQDDIDDDGNDWEFVNGSTVMQAGIGYATTLTSFAYDIAPGASNKQFRYTFTGDFHNGIYTVPIYRNDSETNDNNWNFIGNPYPSAIDVDLFLAANTEIDETNTFPARPITGAIYLWSQDTPPSAIANGNQQLNFSDSDFAIINGITQIAGGDGVSPINRKIPSGQSFFISYSDSATPVSTSINGDGHAIAQGNITFNNSMRTTGAADNSLFFRNSDSKKNSNSQANKLWLNLISDNGIFNQTAIAYVDGATDADDGSYFDAQKNASIVTGAILYTNIEDSNKKFGIQGKAANSLDINEAIQLGFKSNVGVATLFKLSIDHLQGDFLTNNTIYLKDNLLNKLHDLSTSDYTFTSEVGEFNDRFEIVFNENALSTNDLFLDKNSLSIIELDNDHVQFKASNSLSIKTVTIFDLLGRQLYDFKGQKSSETYRLSNLNSTIYVAKVTLSNGAIITKKALKQ